LPRRLGDDPLARGKNRTARAAKSKAPDSSTASHAIQSGISSNDVFFQRRSQQGDTATTVEQQRATEAPDTAEISEISEIPTFREVAAVQVQNDKLATPIGAPQQAEEPSHDSEAPLTSSATPSESDQRIVPEGALAVETSAPTEPVPKDEPRVPAELPAPSQENGQPQPEKGHGFFKRLFNRFGK